MRHHALPVTLTLLLFALSTLAVACGDDEGASAGRSSGVTTATPGRTVTAEPRDAAIAAWEASICPVIDDFREDYLALDDSAVPETLSVAERKLRSERLTPPQRAAAERAASRLAEVQPPSEVERIHHGLRVSFEELALALETRREAVADATTAAEIDATNPPVLQILTPALDFRTFLEQSGYCRGPSNRPEDGA